MKNREEILYANVSEKTRQLIHNAETIGKVPTFPVVLDITTDESLPDLCTPIKPLIRCDFYSKIL